jgi:tRNA/rRNA methyltransferase
MRVRTGQYPEITVAEGEPALAGAPLTVRAVVKAAYDGDVKKAAALATPPLPRDAVEAAIDYCASRACDTAGAYCRGCRLRQQAEGVLTLDDYCRQFARIEIEDGGLGLSGSGRGTLRAPSLASLVSVWVAEETWFLARRVHRRLIKQAEPRPKRMANVAGLGDGPAVVLVNPQMADNIGMVARAMANFGLEEMRLVAPRDGWPNEKARAAASGANHVIEQARAYPDLRSCVGDLNWICATTARQRHMRKTILTPEQAATEMLRRIERGERVGMLFGPERQGLESDDVAIADDVVMAPVDPRFASLNLAQAVLLLAYEWLKASEKGTLGRVTSLETPLAPGLDLKGGMPATKEELIGFFEHLERELDAASFLKPVEKRRVMVRNIRTMFERIGASEQEVRTLRGIVAALSGAHRPRVKQP